MMMFLTNLFCIFTSSVKKRNLQEEERLICFLKSKETFPLWKKIDNFFVDNFLEIKTALEQDKNLNDKKFAMVCEGFCSSYVLIGSSTNSFNFFDKMGQKNLCFFCNKDSLRYRKESSKSLYSIVFKDYNLLEDLKVLDTDFNDQIMFKGILAPLSDSYVDAQVLNDVLKKILNNTNVEVCFLKPLNNEETIFWGLEKTREGNFKVINLPKYCPEKQN